jgi:hypothetical protein
MISFRSVPDFLTTTAAVLLTAAVAHIGWTSAGWLLGVLHVR